MFQALGLRLVPTSHVKLQRAFSRGHIGSHIVPYLPPFRRVQADNVGPQRSLTRDTSLVGTEAGIARSEVLALSMVSLFRLIFYN